MSQILDSLENARLERESNKDLSSSTDSPDDEVNPFEARDADENGALLNPVVWLVVLISIFFAIYIAVEFELSGEDLLDKVQTFFSGL